MNILLTGGAGFIGSSLVKRLTAKSHHVTVLDNLSPQIHGEKRCVPGDFVANVRFIHGDVRNRNDWLSAIKGQDTVVHLAAETGTGQSMYEIDRYVDVNIRGTALLLEILANQPNDVRKVVVASSRAIYGEGRYWCTNHGVVFPVAREVKDMSNGDFAAKCPHCRIDVDSLATTEDSKIHPSSIYGLTKQCQEQMVGIFGCSKSINTVALRYQNVYGPGQSLNNPYTGILSIFSNRILNRKEIIVFEDGDESRDFVFIDDVVSATVSAIESDKCGNYVFNVGSGISTDIKTVARSLVEAYGIDVPVKISCNFRIGDIRHNYADLTLVKSKIGFEPTYSFDQGIKLFAQWVKTQSIAVDGYDKSILEMKSRGLYR
jgi:dTDP-L-rhamnose 4-epimerase